MQRRQLGLLDCGQTDDDYGFGIVEGGWRVELQVERGILRKAEAGNVLVLRGAEQAGEVDQIDHGADIG